jgi:hypothetical protein
MKLQSECWFTDSAKVHFKIEETNLEDVSGNSLVKQDIDGLNEKSWW